MNQNISDAADAAAAPVLPAGLDPALRALCAMVQVAREPLDAAAASEMILPPVVQAGHPALRASSITLADAEFEFLSSSCAPGSAAGSWLEEFTGLMSAVMHAAPGVGLAAPQLGVPVRVMVMHDPAPGEPDQLRRVGRVLLPESVAINPEYECVGSERVAHWEGCLSVAGWMALVPRATTIKASWRGLDGVRHSEVLEGWPARIFQHETDHLNGVICHDLALPRTLCQMGEYERWGSDVAAFVQAMGAELPLGVVLA